MILVYLNEEDKKLIDVLEGNRFTYALIGDQQKDKTMKELLENPEASKASGQTFLFISGLEEKAQTWLADALKENEIFIPRVAIETPYNIDWTLGHLLDEVEREYQYFSTRDTLFRLIMNPDKERIASDKEYLKLMAYGLSLVEKEDASVEEMKECIEHIESIQQVSLAQRIKHR